IIIPNDRLLDLCDQKVGVDNAFKMADDVLRQGVQAISEVITCPGMINLDFADVKAVRKDAGPAWMSIGRGTGKNRAVDAAKEALASPLLDVTIAGSKGVLFNIVGSSDLTLYEVNEAAEVIKQAVDPDANIIFGVAHDPNMSGDIRITLITTGFVSKNEYSDDTEEDELTRQLKNIKTEDELDVPSFLRRPLFSRQRQAFSATDRVVKPQQKANKWFQ
ncbi:MAG: cell division protein FtsZ, partial [Dehalococcoidales bacterium]|nr:cell division protein FtsZ [Dehalococcoidales bacterium]